MPEFENIAAPAHEQKHPNMKLNELEVNRITINSDDRRMKMVFGKALGNGVGITIHDKLTSHTFTLAANGDAMIMEMFDYCGGERLGLFRGQGRSGITFRGTDGQREVLYGNEIPLMVNLLKDAYYITPGSPLDLTFAFHPEVPQDKMDVIQNEILAAAKEIVQKHLGLEPTTLGPEDEIVECEEVKEDTPQEKSEQTYDVL